MATKRKNKKYYVFSNKQNNKIGKESFLDPEVFENSPVVLMSHRQGEDPEVFFQSSLDGDGEIGVFEIDCLPMGAQRISKKDFEKMTEEN